MSMAKALKYADTAIKNAKAPAAGQLDYKIEGRPGLRLRVAASGLKTWTHLYRHNGILRRAMIGTYPAVSLADADKRWGAARDAIRAGSDPYPTRAQRKEQARLARVAAERAEASSFRSVAEAYLADRGSGGAANLRSRNLVERRLEIHAMPVLGDRPIGEITRAEVRDLLRNMVANDKPVAANRLLGTLKLVFKWAVENDKIDASPIVDLGKPAAETSRDRILTDDEFVEVWRACDQLSPVPAAAIRVLMLTGARRTEVGSMARSEFRGDEWHLPAERSKNGKPHVWPLPAKTRTLIESVPAHDDCDFVFSIDGETAIRGWARIKTSLDRAITKTREANGIAESMPPWTLHDIRRTVATRLHEALNVPPHIVEACIGHLSGAAKAGVAGVYNRASYMPQRIEAFDRWAQYVSALTAGKATKGITYTEPLANVTEIKRGRRAA